MSTQRRFWNWEDDDLTADLNKWLLGILPSGLYRGFEFSPTGNLTLNLVHTGTGEKKVKTDETETAETGIILTRQGVVITEDGTITVPVNANNDANPRIDTVAVQHTYVESTGGAVATYVVIQGVAGVGPAAPALTFPNTQVKLGELYLPGNTTLLNAAGVVYTKEEIPFLGNHTDNFAYLDKAQVWAYLQEYARIRFSNWQYSTIDSDNCMVLPEDGHLFVYSDFLTTPFIHAITNPGYQGKLLVFRCDEGDVYLSQNNPAYAHLKNINVPRDGYMIRQGDPAMLMSGWSIVNSRYEWYLMGTVRGDNAQLHTVNEYTQQQRFNKGTAPTYTIGTYTLNLPEDGNYFTISTMNVSGVNEIISLTALRTGTELTVCFTNGCILTPGTYASSDPVKDVDTTDGLSVRVPAGGLVTFVEESDRWLVKGVYSKNSRKRVQEVIQLNDTADAAEEYVSLNPKTDFAKLVNISDSTKMKVHWIDVKDWYHIGYTVTLEFSNRGATKSIILESKTGSNGGNIALHDPTNTGTQVIKSGATTGSTAAVQFVTLMWNGSFWQELYRTTTYAA